MNIHVTSDGLIKDNGVFPDLRVSLRSQDLHAPLVERMVELPMDITAGASLAALPHFFHTSDFVGICRFPALVLLLVVWCACCGSSSPLVLLGSSACLLAPPSTGYLLGV